MAIGERLDQVQSPRMILWYEKEPYENVSCSVIFVSFVCLGRIKLY